MTRRLPGGALMLLVLGFLSLPVLALVTFAPPAELWQALDDGSVRDALGVSLKTNAIAAAVMLALGTPCAYLLRRPFRGRAVVLTAIELPLVLPPAAAGIALLAAFGRHGLLATDLGFSQAAVVAAILLVAGPIYLRASVAAFAALDPALLDVAATLGAGPVRRMLRVAVPIAADGLGAALALALARGIGEFGATIFFAGSLQGSTQTLPLAIYAQFGVSFERAVAIGALLLLASAALLLAAKIPWRCFKSRSNFRGVRLRYASHSS